MAQRVLSIGRGQGLRAQLVRGALGVGGLKLLSVPLTMATSILLARGLGPAGYGQYAFVMALMSILALPIGPGLGQLVTREVARYQQAQEWGFFRGLIRRAHQWSILGSLAIVAVVAIVGFKSADWSVTDRWTLILAGSLLLPLLGLNALRSSTLRGLRHVFYAQLPELLARPALHLAIAAALVLSGLLNPLAAIGSQVVATGVAFLSGAWLLRRYRPAPIISAKPAYQSRQWGRALAPFMLLQAVSVLNMQIGIIALGWLGTSEEVAALQVAQSGAVLTALSLTVINLVIAPYITHACRGNDRRTLQRLTRQSARAALLGALPIALPLIFFGGPILDLVYGASYAEPSKAPLAILVIGQVVNAGFGSVGQLLTMSGFERSSLGGQLAALICNGVSAVLLIPPLGATGAAIAAALGMVLWNLLMAIEVIRKVKVRPSAF